MSIGLDPQLCLYTPIAGSCIVVRDPDVLSVEFAVHSTYIVDDDDTGWGADVYSMSPHFTRSFAALKVWVSLLAHGWDAYERRISHDVDLAHYLQQLVVSHPELDPVTEPGLSITCFRYVPPDLQRRPESEAYLNDLNERIMFDLQLGGRVFPSNAIVNGRFALRSCIVNFRTEAENMDELVTEAVRIGRELDDDLRPQELR